MCVCMCVSGGGHGVKMTSLLKFSGFSFAFFIELAQKNIFLMQRHESVGIYSHEKSINGNIFHHFICLQCKCQFYTVHLHQNI